MSTKRLRWGKWVALLTTLAGGYGVRAQDPQDSKVPVFRAAVNVVRVDVTVEDRDKRLVEGLTAADFELQEDGVLQRVDTAQLLRRNGARQSDLDEALPIRSREHAESEAVRDDVRLFAIFLDDYHVERNQQVTLRVRDALQVFVRGFGPNDLLTVMDPLTPLSALRYTRSFGEVAARVRAFEGRLGQLFPVRSVFEEAQIQSANVWQIRASVTLSALEALVVHLGGLGEGRKSILFVSQGPPISVTSPDAQIRLQAIVRAANRGNVTIHSYDPRPLGTSWPGGAYASSRLADETGGRTIANVNNPLPQLAQVMADASAYYLLGYTPTRTADDGQFHRIEVRVKRPGVRVTARKGYWAAAVSETDAKPTPPRAPMQKDALARLASLPRGRIVDTWLGVSRLARSVGSTRVTVAWDPVADSRNRHRATSLEVEALEGGPGILGENSLPLEEVRSIEEGETTAFDFVVGQRVTWRFSARNSDGNVIDGWDEAMAVVDLRSPAVSLATPRVFRARTSAESKALNQGAMLAPTATRRFRVSDRIVVELEGYAGDGQPDSLTVEVLGADEKQLVALLTDPGPRGHPRAVLPVSSLAPGIYVLRARAEAGRSVAEERIAFEVTP